MQLCNLLLFTGLISDNMKTNNQTFHGIKDDAERSVLIVWSVTVLLTSLIGDSTILIATIKYNAINQHKVIVAIMQNLAVCDLLQAVLKVFPSILSFTADRWVLGRFLCHFDENISLASRESAFFLTCTLATAKVIMVKYPLRTGAWSSSRLGHKICGAVWALVLCLCIPMVVVQVLYVRDTLYFSYISYDCNYDRSIPSCPSWFRLYGKTRFASSTLL